MPSEATKTKRKTQRKETETAKISVDEKYKSRSLHKAILKGPDTYIGSIEENKQRMWIYNEDAKEGEPLFILKEISYIPGLYKICDEIFVNARDHEVRSKTCNKIKVDVDAKNNSISVWNNGEGIEVQEHKKAGVMVPTMIFGKLLTSGNYDEKEEKIVGGKNGYGAKLTNIWSKQFEIETLDTDTNKKFYQKFENNMFTVNEPKITSGGGKSGYTQITFQPDLEKFHVDKLGKEMIGILKKRTYDLAMNTTASVFYNGEKIVANTFQKFVDAHFGDNSEVIKAFDVTNERWKVCVAYDPNSKLYNKSTELVNGIFHVSFVNGIYTNIGGTHVDYVTGQIIKAIQEAASSKVKGIKITPNIIKENLIFFIDATIVNPSFNSQSKEKLNTKKEKFGSTYEAPEKFIKKILKSGIIEQVITNATMKAEAALSRKGGGKRSLFHNKKLFAAAEANTRNGHKCSLILTEGDSALQLALAGLNVVGRKFFGAFPLKGKLLNVKKASIDKILENNEIEAIMKIIGLQQGKRYDSVKGLKYGRIIIMADQDVDGSHIKGLLISLIEKYWPDLLKLEGFIQCLPTPIVMAKKGPKGKKQSKNSFYSLQEFEKWKQENNDGRGWTLKYYKGLGTSTKEDAREYFKDVEDKLIHYYWQTKVKESKKGKQIAYETKAKDVSKDALSLAFDKKRENDRKHWLSLYNPKIYLDNAQKEVSYYEFIHKELITFSIYSVERAIPSIMDGFKPSQRKIYYAAELKGLYGDKEIKVAQFGGFISEKTGYHHGEESLNKAIVAMAQDFVGSNNINLLMPNGSFGSRISGGKDYSAPRYIFTQLNDLSKIIFNPYDYDVLEKQYDDADKNKDKEIEPKYYAPIMPMILINGTNGIATAYATDISPVNPRDIYENILLILKDEKPKKMKPWFRNFGGAIESVSKNKYICRAKYTIEGDILKVTDLPIGTWTENYKQFCIKLIEEIGSAKKGKKAEAKATKTKAKAKPKGKTKGKKGANNKYLASKAKKSATAKVSKNNPIAASLVNIDENCTDEYIEFIFEFKKGQLKKYVKAGTLEKYLKLSTAVNLSNMHLFDTEGRIKKYESYNEILREYCIKRLELYQMRKDYLLKKWQHEMDILEWKIKFIRYYHEGKILIVKNGRPVNKAKLIEQLEEHKFPKFAVNDEVNKTYNYVTNIRVIELTEEEIDALQAKFDAKKKEFETLEGKTPKKMWKEELKDFMEAYDKWDSEQTSEYNKRLKDCKVA